MVADFKRLLYLTAKYTKIGLKIIYFFSQCAGGVERKGTPHEFEFKYFSKKY